MRINLIEVQNFRQYYGTNSINLETSSDRNIILIGGKNGYGKTNFLMSLVWCLYGEDITKIDDNFKKEIQKAGNYSKYLKNSLNWDAEKANSEEFFVELNISDIELPDTMNIKSGFDYKCKIKRSFNTKSSTESFLIEIEGLDADLFTDQDYKKIFVNDYLIPIEAAKFVFFDAEKIASWAELSTKEEGSVLNDALGKILGLDIYESLANDLKIYTDSLRKDSATNNVKLQITTTEKGIELNLHAIADIEDEIIAIESNTSDLKLKAQEYQMFLSVHGSNSFNTTNLDDLYKQKDKLVIQEKELEIKFTQLSEMIPFAVAAAKLEEVIDHLSKQEDLSTSTEKIGELFEKNSVLVEKLFNSPPFPTDGDISFSSKVFYAEKAKNIVDDLFGINETVSQLNFEHDLNKSDSELIIETFQYVKRQSKDTLEQTIDSFTRIKNELLEIDRLIKRIETDQQDEEIIRYTNNKTEAERRIEKLIEERGGLQNQANQLKKLIDSDRQRLQILIKKIEVSEQKVKKLDKTNLYIKALENFIDEQKKSKCASLEFAIFDEMQKLMHKLQDKRNNNFVAAVKAEPLPDNDGIKITLLDADGKTRNKESLSQGEKQIYISSLIKAILSLSIQDFPIFIDTPLGRMDDEHIKNILLNYYPDLANQVILMATNNEIPPSRFKLMQSNVAQTYLLENKSGRTSFKKGYFQSYENKN